MTTPTRGSVWELDQRSPAWHALRKGRITASVVADLLQFGGPSKAYHAWRKVLGIEDARSGEPTITECFLRELGWPVWHAVPRVEDTLNGVPAIEYGRAMEPVAALAYECLIDGPVEWQGNMVAFPPAPDDKLFMASPDAVLHRDTLLEFKCPFTRERALDKTDRLVAYWIQVQFQLYATALSRGQLVFFIPPLRDGTSGAFHIWDIAVCDDFLAEIIPVLRRGLTNGQPPTLIKSRMDDLRNRVRQHFIRTAVRRPTVIIHPEDPLLQCVDAAIVASNCSRKPSDADE